MNEFCTREEALKEVFFGSSRKYWAALSDHPEFPKPYKLGQHGKEFYRTVELINFRETKMRAA